MKQSIGTYIVVLLIALCASSCKEQYTTYNDAEYIMFADTLSSNPVLVDNNTIKVAVSSTVSRSYDRTLGIEIVEQGSNAIEGLHYRLRTPSITIPAGKLSADVEIEGCYENIEATDSLGFVLRLVMNENLKWPLAKNSDQTKVVLYKSCPFDINNFTGYAVLSSMFLLNYPGENASYQRLVYTRRHKSEPNCIVIEDCFFDGYDITLRLHGDDPARPVITMDSDQVVSDEASVFGQILGDNHILCDDSAYNESYFNSCQHFAVLWTHIYVENIGVTVGTVGNFYNILEWVSDEEAERIKREGL